jgi:hypothetical protein
MPLFLFIFHILLHTYIHLITFIHYIYPSPFAIAITISISSSRVSSVGENLPVVPSRESNSGLPYSKPTRYQLCHAAPDFSLAWLEAACYFSESGQAQLETNRFKKGCAKYVVLYYPRSEFERTFNVY